MGRWLARLRDAENIPERPPGVTLKTIKTPSREVLKVLKVGGGGLSNKKNDDGLSPEPPAIAKPITFSDLSPEDQIAAFEERAGILEYDEGLPRDEAEQLAREQTRHLLH